MGSTDALIAILVSVVFQSLKLFVNSLYCFAAHVHSLTLSQVVCYKN